MIIAWLVVSTLGLASAMPTPAIPDVMIKKVSKGFSQKTVDCLNDCESSLEPVDKATNKLLTSEQKQFKICSALVSFRKCTEKCKDAHRLVKEIKKELPKKTWKIIEDCSANADMYSTTVASMEGSEGTTVAPMEGSDGTTVAPMEGSEGTTIAPMEGSEGTTVAIMEGSEGTTAAPMEGGEDTYSTTGAPLERSNGNKPSATGGTPSAFSKDSKGSKVQKEGTTKGGKKHCKGCKGKMGKNKGKTEGKMKGGKQISGSETTMESTMENVAETGATTAFPSEVDTDLFSTTAESMVGEAEASTGAPMEVESSTDKKPKSGKSKGGSKGTKPTKDGTPSAFSEDTKGMKIQKEGTTKGGKKHGKTPKNKTDKTKSPMETTMEGGDGMPDSESTMETTVPVINFGGSAESTTPFAQETMSLVTSDDLQCLGACAISIDMKVLDKLQSAATINDVSEDICAVYATFTNCVVRDCGANADELIQTTVSASPPVVQDVLSICPAASGSTDANPEVIKLQDVELTITTDDFSHESLSCLGNCMISAEIPSSNDSMSVNMDEVMTQFCDPFDSMIECVGGCEQSTQLATYFKTSLPQLAGGLTETCKSETSKSSKKPGKKGKGKKPKGKKGSSKMGQGDEISKK